MEDANALALEILAHGAPINRISLKQYPDAEDVEKACYQALVNTQRSITDIYDIREILDPVHVRLYQIPLHPIARVLGLKIKSVYSAKGNVVDIIQPVRPFWMHIAVKEELGRVICTVNDKPLTKDINVNDPSHSEPKRDMLFHGDQEFTGHFYRAGSTRVGRENDQWDVVATARPGHRARLGLKDQANDWLRKSLKYEFAWIRSALDSDKSELEKLYQNLSDSDCGRVRLLMSTSSISGYCAAASVDSLMGLVDAIIKPRPDLLKDMYVKPADLKDDSSDPKAGASGLVEDFRKLDQQLKDWGEKMKESRRGKELVEMGGSGSVEWAKQQTEIQYEIDTIQRHLHYCINVELPRFSKIKRKAIELCHDMGVRLKELLSIEGYGLRYSGNDYNRLGGRIFEDTAYQAFLDKNEMLFDMLPDYSGVPNPVAEAHTIVEGINSLVDDWIFIMLFRRLMWPGAVEAIDKLDELQLVLESVLNRGWENRDEKWDNWDKYIIREEHQSARDWKREGADQRIRIESAMDEWAVRHGLVRSVDPRFGNSWIVPPPR
jgi:hypothetical protein